MSFRLLVIAFDFPPFVGGGGSVRMVKLVKYLHRQCVDVRVLTGGFETRDADPSLLAELAGVPIHVANPVPIRPNHHVPTRRARGMRLAGQVVRHLLPFPDNRFRHLPAMRRAADGIIQRDRVDVVLITSPPNSMSMLVPLLRWRHPDLRLVLDIRDLWALDPLLTPDTRYFRFLQRHLERWTLGFADHIVSATPGFHEWIVSQTGRPEACSVITNGYDEEDFGNLEPPPEPGPVFVMTYAGSVGGVNGPRNLLPTLLAMEDLENRRPELRGKLLLQVAGHVDSKHLPPLRCHMDAGRLALLGYVSHHEALLAQRRSDAILILLFDKPHLDRVYPGKLFEACRLGRPLAAFSPPGLLTRFVLERDLGEVAGINSREEQSAALEHLVDRCRKGPDYDLPCRDLLSFERGRLARTYHDLLEHLSSLT